MPRTKAGAQATENPTEAGESTESKEHVDLDGDDDPEETIEEEEVEYEEIEEEEVEEVEEEEEEEEEVEEEIEEEEENEGATDASIKVAEGVPEDEKKQHAELLALPPHGSEVYLGGIPRDASEDDLRAFCESIGEVTEVRIMKGKDSGEAKGYAFVTFRNKELASRAIRELNNSELKGRKIKCSTSQAKHRLFIGNVPRNWDEEDMKKALMDVGPGVVSVELLKQVPHAHNSSQNRGFAFVAYYNSACAEYARQKMSNPNFRLESNAPTVSWADPRNAESSSTSQVKAVYVKNLPKDITQDRLRRLFEHHGKIAKVVLPPAKLGHENSRFGFVHFEERSSAMKALKNTEKYEIDGQVLDCSLAKPQVDQKSFGVENSHNSALLPTYPPYLGFGMIGGAHGAVGAGFGGAGFGQVQPLIYGRGPTPAGMAMMPMLLPDGRVGYVLQQPSLQPHIPPPQSRGSRTGPGGSSSGGRHGSDSNRGRNRYHPY
ncbi:heterogeneous nuclear ribonucleoprotein Q isoform X1 [Morus notabilis]|uniref:heterogeneous nuclear ribonucleoprotein Q isoform X1 n=1 Tax=Morus notabilis TaxID=981085 RepID=UPI000CED52B9|nr:heterogeneous nuclear ribonucleoprotein Q isoform X1 [Morus notabilis]XP_024024789.1 heterogeneous nuclear ribonucleoprotein Q isoform X1 [Morus notabilis]